MGTSPSNLLNRNKDFQSVMPFPDGQDNAPEVRQRTNSIEDDCHQYKTRKFSSSNSNLASVSYERVIPDNVKLLTDQRPSSSESARSMVSNTPSSVRRRPPASVEKRRSSSALSQNRSNNSLMDELYEVNNENNFVYTEGQSKRRLIADYEEQCTEITAFLFVGGEKVASSWETLSSLGITHIVNCCNMVVPDFFTDKEGMKYLTLNMVDGRQDDISWFLPEVINFIESSRLANRKVLVHCEKGISRSCSLIIAYIMWSTGDSWKDAFDFVKSRRGICAPNTGFTCNLIEINELFSGEARNYPLIFRCATHLPHDISTIVLKMCRNSTTRRLLPPARSLLDQNGVFVIRPSSSIKSVVYIWQGYNAHDVIVDKTIELCKQLTGSFLSGNSIEVVKSGYETPEFNRILIQDEPHDPRTHYFYFDLYRVSAEKSPRPGSTSPDKMSTRPSSEWPDSATQRRYDRDREEEREREKQREREKEIERPLSKASSSSRSRLPSLDLPGPLPLARDSPSPAPLRTREADPEIENVRKPLFQERTTPTKRNMGLSLNMSKLNIEVDQLRTHDSTTSVSSSSSGRPKIKPHLFIVHLNELTAEGRHRWTALGVYDDQDLDETAVLLLVCPRPPHFLWIGDEVDVDKLEEESEGLVDTFPMQIEEEVRGDEERDETEEPPRKMRKWLRTVDPGDLLEGVNPAQKSDLLNEKKLIIERGQNESEAFWTAFEEGF